MVKVDISGAEKFFDGTGPDYSAALSAHRMLIEGTGCGCEFTGWLSLPSRIIAGEMKRILQLAERIRSTSQVLVVTGIGGSYLGARAAIELLRSGYHNAVKSGDPEVYFVGNSLSPSSITEVISIIGDRDFSVNVISKSGGTLEPAAAFRIFKALLEAKYGTAKAKQRIIATTDGEKGVLKKMADAEGYDCLTVPDDVGGRFSVLSAVGLLPMAAAGIDIERVLKAARDEMRMLELMSPDNPAWKYAACRQHLYRSGKTIEILASYEPSFRFMSEWWKQLYGESEGKSGVGIYPASAEYTSDLHSMGQYIQDGPRRLFETAVFFEKNSISCKLPFVMGDPDGLNYLAGKELSHINRTVSRAVRDAHIYGGVPNIEILVPENNEEGLAALICFFEVSCAISGYMSGVNPFDQPGVEEYKKNMFRMLGKPE